MSLIKPPPVTTDDCFLSRQEAIEGKFSAMVAKDVAAGWTFEEVIVSLLELADHHMLPSRSMSDTEAVLEIVKRMT